LATSSVVFRFAILRSLSLSKAVHSDAVIRSAFNSLRLRRRRIAVAETKKSGNRIHTGCRSNQAEVMED